MGYGGDFVATCKDTFSPLMQFKIDILEYFGTCTLKETFNNEWSGAQDVVNTTQLSLSLLATITPSLHSFSASATHVACTH